MNAVSSWAARFAAVLWRQLRISAGLLFLIGVGLSAWAAYRLVSTSDQLIYRKTSNINVFDLRPTPEPTPSPTPTPDIQHHNNPPVEGWPSVDFKLSDNDLTQRIFRVDGFDEKDFGSTFKLVEAIKDSPHPVPVSYTSPDAPAELPETREQIEAYWPEEMSKSGSESIVVVLQNKAGAPIMPSIDVKDYKSKPATAEAPPKAPEGADYKSEASVTLDPVNFEVKLSSNEWQPLNSPKAEWIWNIRPKHDAPVSGQQRLNAYMKVRVIDTSGNVVSAGEIWKGDVKINVYDSWFSKDPINLTSLIGLIVGTGITAPWIYERLKERSERKKKALARRRIKIKIGGRGRRGKR
jgi:hypothetical protein